MELDYRNSVSVTVAMEYVHILQGGSEFFPRLIVERAFTQVGPKEADRILSRVRNAVNTQAVSEAFATVREREEQAAKQKAEERKRRGA